MKKLFVVMMVALASLSAVAQSKFNGTVKYAIDYKGDMVEMLRGMMPNTQVFHYLDGNFRMEMHGGMAGGQSDVLYTTTDGKTYLLNSTSRKAQLLPANSKQDDAAVIVTETGEKATILGYECNKYKIVMTDGDNQVIQYVWATKAIEPVKPKAANNPYTASLGGKIKGMPLKTEMQINQGGISFTMIMTATSIDDEKPQKDLFVIPSDYTVEDFNIKSLTR